MNSIAREEVARRLKAIFAMLKARTGMTQVQFARKYKFPGGASMISQQINNRRPIGLEHAAIYIEGFKDSLGGVDSIADINPMLTASAETVAKAVTGGNILSLELHGDGKVKPKGKRFYPVITEEQARDIGLRAEPYGLDDGYDVAAGDEHNSDWTFVIELSGDAMLPDFGPGDHFFIDPKRKPKPGNCVAAADAVGHVTVRQYRELYADQHGKMIFELAPLNKIHATIRSDLQPCTIIGVAVEVNKRLIPREE